MTCLGRAVFGTCARGLSVGLQNGASVLLHGTSLSGIRATMNLFKQQLVIAFKTFHHHAANDVCSCVDFPA
jgi:hypothetical protein